MAKAGDKGEFVADERSSTSTTEEDHRDPLPEGADRSSHASDKAWSEKHEDQWSEETPVRSGSLNRILSTLRSGNEQPRTWQETFIRLAPLSGVFAMLLAIASIVSSLGILAGSDHQPVSEWVSPPSTYLAIFTAIANLSIRYAALQGAVISWWHKASKETNLAELHWTWQAGHTLRGALTSGRKMGLVGLACIVSVIVAADGPLLQRASTVVPSRVSNHRVTLDIQMVPEIPRGYTGTWATSREFGIPGEIVVPSFNDTVPTVNGPASNNIWSWASQDVETSIGALWWDDAALPGVVSGCPKSCTAKIIAPALFPICTDHSIPYSAEGIIDMQGSLAGMVAPPLDHQAFFSWPFLSIEQHEVLNLITGFADLHNCQGPLNYSICELQSGIGEYEVEIEENHLLMDSVGTPSFIALANNTAANQTFAKHWQGHVSTLAGVAALLYTRYSALAVNGVGPKGNMLSWSIGVDTLRYTKHSTYNQCFSFRDPQPDIFKSMNQLMIFLGAYATKMDVSYLAENLDEGLVSQVNTITTGYLTNLNVFHTDYWFFLGAALLEAICIAVVAITYWGWWRLGRPVSFSPLEIAKAFESPMLAYFNSNSTGRDMAEADDEQRVKYGVRTPRTTCTEYHLAIRDTASVTRPSQGMQFGV